MWQPGKVATPAVTVLLRPPVQVSVPAGPLVGVPGVIDSVTTVVLSDATVAPLASTTRTVGCVAHVVPPVRPVGGVRTHGSAVPQQTATALAGPDVTSNAPPCFGARPPAPSSAVSL